MTSKLKTALAYLFSPDAARIAEELRASDFGGDINARIGLSYMKGEIEVLKDERDEARQRHTETLTTLNKLRSDTSMQEYRYEKQLRELGQEFRDYKIVHPETGDDYEDGEI